MTEWSKALCTSVPKASCDLFYSLVATRSLIGTHPDCTAGIELGSARIGFL